MIYLDEDFLKLNRNLNQSNLKRRFHEIISQPWYVSSFFLLFHHDFSLIAFCFVL